MRVVIALDKFKGTFSAREACELLAEGIRHRNPKIELIQRPMADGGDGTASILAQSLGMDAMRVEVPDLFGKKTEAHVYWQNSRRLAIIESAEVLGVTRASAQEDLLLRSNTFGLGRLILKALELRPLEIWLGVGGTMTADAGWGAATAFGLQAFDEGGNVLEPCLLNMDKIARIQIPNEQPEYLKRSRVFALCDVIAPATGPHVSLSSFLAQKGASPGSVESIEKKIKTFWGQLKVACPHVPKLEDAFMGAGGGLCMGLSAVLPNFVTEKGALKIARATALGQCLQDADLIICGEGCFDELTLYGKTVTAVTQMANDHQVKAWGVFGKATGDVETLKQKAGLSQVFTLFSKTPVGTKDLIKQSKVRFHEIGADIAHKLEIK